MLLYICQIKEKKKFERVGGEQTIEVDVRVIAATNKNLEEEIKKGNFRDDLYFRLNVVHIEVPPLRERKEDISLLVNAFLDEFNKENNRSIKGISSQAKKAIQSYDWPGNIRELRNCIESAVVMCTTEEIQLEDLPSNVVKSSSDNVISIPFGITLEEAEKIIIERNLMANSNNKSKTADILGIGRKTLQRKLSEWGDDDGDHV